MEIKKKANKLFEGKIFTIYCDDILLQNGSETTREYIVHHGGAAVLAVDDEGFCYMVKQYRYPVGDYLLEIPAGKLNKGEDPYACAVRELKEETGIVAKSVEPLIRSVPVPAYCTETIHIYLATGLSFEEQSLDNDEFLSVERMSVEDALQKIESGEIRDGKTQLALLCYKNKLQ